MKEQEFVKRTVEFSKTLSPGFVKKLCVFDSLDSTNSTAKELAAAGAEEGTVVISRIQHHGRGRFDRIWQSPEGGVYLSLILRPRIPTEKLSLLPLVAGLAVVRTMDSYRLHTTMKWPNDVVVNGKKIAGILLESEAEGDVVCYLVVGIGMNLNVDVKVLPPNIRPLSTSVLSETGSSIDYYKFLRTFFAEFEKTYTILCKQNYEWIIKEWKNRTDTLGKTVHVKTSGEIIQGVAVDIDPSGFLLLKTEKGDIKRIYSGDCLYW